ncbi:MAG: hypothetical protein Q4B48_07625, partial [Syntrophomonadaceae bacterium]|nr:hypothetical protein [Syntrophomonadaceae bacterium]
GDGLYIVRAMGHGGQGHNKSFHVADPYEYYVVPAKWFALMAYRLLKDNAQCARQIIADNPPMMTPAEYVKRMDNLKKVERIEIAPVPKDFA